MEEGNERYVLPEFITPTSVELVRYMRDEKGITFEHMSEEEAVVFLDRKNFFFKVKAFAKNYQKYSHGEREGQYINLDFAYLVELSRLDKALRALVLSLTLDIEHCLKVRINSAAMDFSVNRYELSDSFQRIVAEQVIKEQAQAVTEDISRDVAGEVIEMLESVDHSNPEAVAEVANRATKALARITKNRNPSYIEESIAGMGTSAYSGDLVRKYSQGRMPYWCLLELLTFGSVVRLYKMCFEKNGLIPQAKGDFEVRKSINPYLRSVQGLRNAAAHSDCLINGLARHGKRSKAANRLREALVSEYGLDEKVVSEVISVGVAVDLASTLICYDTLVPQGESRSDAARMIGATRERMLMHESWFRGCNDVKYFLSFLDALFAAMEDRLKGRGRQAD